MKRGVFIRPLFVLCLNIGKEKGNGDVPAGVLRIMRASDSVEVQLFEEQDVFQHALLIDGFSCLLVVLMTACSFEQDWLVVVQEVLMLDLISLKAHLLHTTCFNFGTKHIQ